MAEPISIRPFEWTGWVSLYQLHVAQLAEHGVFLGPDDIPESPEDTDPGSPEYDIDHMGEVYLSGAGGFWLAWCGEMPAGHIGAQDLGGIVELRRMYVQAAVRRRGIGTRLVRAVVEHCRARGIRAIELWTAPEGPGRFLYERQGFRQVAAKGPGYEDAADRTDEIRMRLDLTG